MFVGINESLIRIVAEHGLQYGNGYGLSDDFRWGIWGYGLEYRKLENSGYKSNLGVCLRLFNWHDTIVYGTIPCSVYHNLRYAFIRRSEKIVLIHKKDLRQWVLRKSNFLWALISLEIIRDWSL